MCFEHRLKKAKSKVYEHSGIKKQVTPTRKRWTLAKKRVFDNEAYSGNDSGRLWTVADDHVARQVVGNSTTCHA